MLFSIAKALLVIAGVLFLDAIAVLAINVVVLLAIVAYIYRVQLCTIQLGNAIHIWTKLGVLWVAVAAVIAIAIDSPDNFLPFLLTLIGWVVLLLCFMANVCLQRK